LEGCVAVTAAPGDYTRYVSVYEVTLPRRHGESAARMLFQMPRAFLESLPTVRGCRVVVSTGTNLSIPSSLVGKLLRGRLAVLECATRVTGPAKAARFLPRIADLVIIQWPEQVKLFPSAKRVKVVGPVYKPPRYEARDEGYVLVTASTLGHPRLLEAMSRLGLERAVLQTGRVDLESYRRQHPRWTVFQWTNDIDKWIAGARIVVHES